MDMVGAELWMAMICTYRHVAGRRSQRHGTISGRGKRLPPSSRIDRGRGGVVMGFAWVSADINDFGMSQMWERANFSPRHRKPPRWSRRPRAVAGAGRHASRGPGSRPALLPRPRTPPRWSRRLRAVAGLARRASGVPGSLRRPGRAVAIPARPALAPAGPSLALSGYFQRK